MSRHDRAFVVTREYLISLLRAWQQDKITTARFYETIEILHASSDTEFLDWENDGKLVTWESVPSESVTSEVIAHLEMLDLDFVIQEDIEPIIEFLNTPIGKIEEGMKKWQQYKPKTSHEERIKKFNGQYPYIDLYEQNKSTVVTNMNYDIIVTREYLISLLRAWQQDKITVKEVYETANYLYDNVEAIDWENGDDYSATIAVLQYLESLNINLVIQDDIEPAIEFLSTPIGKYLEGNKKWQQYTSKINYDERMKKLSGQYPYI